MSRDDLARPTSISRASYVENVSRATALEIVVVLAPLSRFGGTATGAAVPSPPVEQVFNVSRRWGGTAISLSYGFLLEDRARVGDTSIA